jgi:hypothetical protein
MIAVLFDNKPSNNLGRKFSGVGDRLKGVLGHVIGEEAGLGRLRSVTKVEGCGSSEWKLAIRNHYQGSMMLQQLSSL